MIEVYLMDLPEGTFFWDFRGESGRSYIIFGERKNYMVQEMAKMRAIENSLMTKTPERVIQYQGIMKN